MMKRFRRKGVFHATVLVAFLMGITKLGVLVKDLLIAQFFGLSADLDAFYLALALPVFLMNALGGPYQSVFVPAYIQQRQQNGPEHASLLLRYTLRRAVWLLIGTAAALAAISPLVLPRLAEGFSSAQLALTQTLLFVLAPLIVLYGVVVLFTAALNAEKEFAYPALTPLASPLAIILALYLSAGDIRMLAVGVLVGLTLEVILLGVRLKRRGLLFSWGRVWKVEGYTEMMLQFRLLVVGAVLMGGTQLVDTIMSATLPTGSLSALNLGTKMLGFPLNLAVSALGTAFLPYASHMVATRQWEAIRSMVRHYLAWIFALSLPVVGILFFAAEPLVHLALVRGAFSSEDAHLVASVLANLALQIPFYAGGILLVRMMAAYQDNKKVVWIAGVNLVSNVAFNYVFMQWWGVAGIAFSTSLVYFQSFIILLLAYRRDLRCLEGQYGVG